MTSIDDAASTDTTHDGAGSLLWLPYVALAGVCLVFLAVNFWCYHRRHRLRYQRKAEVLEIRERVQERRMILRMVKARYRNYLDDAANESKRHVQSVQQSSVIYANPLLLDNSAHAQNGGASIELCAVSCEAVAV